MTSSPVREPQLLLGEAVSRLERTGLKQDPSHEEDVSSQKQCQVGNGVVGALRQELCRESGSRSRS